MGPLETYFRRDRRPLAARDDQETDCQLGRATVAGIFSDCLRGSTWASLAVQDCRTMVAGARLLDQRRQHTHYGKAGRPRLDSFVYDTARAKLLQLVWFRFLHDRLVAWRAWSHEMVDPLVREIKVNLVRLTPRRVGRAIRLLRIRSRARAFR